MIDFSGWASNWEWSGYSYGDPPRWFGPVFAVTGVLGCALVFASWQGHGVAGALWTTGALGAAIVVEAVSRDGLDDAPLLFSSYALSATICGLFALIGFRIADPGVRAGLVAAAPSLAFAFGPITSRALAATFFSYEMVDFVRERGELVKATLAGEANALMVRVERLDGEDVLLCTVGEAAGQTLVATHEVLHARLARSVGSHFLLEAPELGDIEVSGYRGASSARRVRSTTKSLFLGHSMTTLPASAYFAEVAAGIVFLVLEHSILLGIAWLIAYWGR